jgi:hypothetical protein
MVWFQQYLHWNTMHILHIYIVTAACLSFALQMQMQSSLANEMGSHILFWWMLAGVTCMLMLKGLSYVLNISQQNFIFLCIVSNN